MKKEIPVSMARRFINAGNIIMVTSAHKSKQNIFTVAWSTPLSHNRPYIGISVAKSHYSWELICGSHEFHLNIPGASLIKAALYCGKHSGREVDKFQETGLTSEAPKKLRHAPGIAECIGQAECRVIDKKDTGDHTFFIGEVLYAQAEKELFNETWDITKVRLIHHFGSALFAASSEIIKV